MATAIAISGSVAEDTHISLGVELCAICRTDAVKVNTVRSHANVLTGDFQIT